MIGEDESVKKPQPVNIQTGRPAPEWLRAVNATLTAWNTFIATCAGFIMLLWLFPSSHDLGGPVAVLLLLVMLAGGALVATVVTKWQVRSMKLSSTGVHIGLLVALVAVTGLALPSLFIF